ncbi:hypothetical protein RRG08_066505 [Elysia crispata]|uniref:Uncharacterized protein n=1 Tax=Elysia crispata TaxID=231223 RepID=A0AAE0YJX5_9GAST|nr:hypothetical protein RRG08_066505 [Elysia crispata]
MEDSCSKGMEGPDIRHAERRAPNHLHATHVDVCGSMSVYVRVSRIHYPCFAFRVLVCGVTDLMAAV